MEFRPQDVAQLVLGYLKDEKCQSAFYEFLSNSTHLKDHAASYQKRKYFVTRIAGLSLVDYLAEYAVIYTIVQERLEFSEFYKENGLRTPLVEQLLYLLGSAGVQSRTSTPIGFDKNINSNQEGNKSISVDKAIQHVPENGTNNSFERLCAGSNTTSIHDLPGNSSTELNFSNNSKNKSGSLPKQSKSTSTDELDIAENPSNCLKQRLRSARKSHFSPIKNPPLIEEQNDDVIQSIVAASLATEQEPVEPEMSSTDTTSNMSLEVAVPNVNYDNFTTTFSAPFNQNQINPNAGGLLMLQPSNTMSCSNILPIEQSKPCYIIGNQPVINIPQTPFKMLTEQDILTMPTIFVCDNNQQPINPQNVIVSQPAMTSMGQNRFANIAPKKMTPEKLQSLSEYINLYKCNDSFTSTSQTQVHQAPAKPKVKLKQITSTSTSSKAKQKNQPHISNADKQTLPQTEEPSLQSFSNINNFTQITAERMMDVNSTEVDTHIQTTIENKHVTPKTKANKKDAVSRSTPRSGSHVRQLDFSTPERWASMLRKANTSPKLEKETNKNNSKNIRTSLFKSPDGEVIPSESAVIATEPSTELNIGDKDTTQTNIKKGTITSSWDADLRALTGLSVPDRSGDLKRKRVEEAPTQSNNSKKLKESAPNLNKTEEDALKIEMALGNIGIDFEDTEVAAENVTENIINTTKTTGKRRDRVTTKKATVVKKVDKTNKESQEKIIEVVPDPPSIDKLSPISVTIDEDMQEDMENLKRTANEQQNFIDKPYAVINRNMKSRIKKKCNIDNTVKKIPLTEEIILTNVTKIKSCEILDDGQNTLILSPSKLNANKRSLVEIESRNTVAEQISVTKSNENVVGNQDETDGKVTTPELLKRSVNAPSSTANYNMMPLLETPVKFDSSSFPKTPGLRDSPSIDTHIIDTPFTKAVIDQLTGVDIGAIPTPKFPITPHFPFTPAREQSPFSNRGTDYSTSSSYYQPSDTEQSKSIEQLIEECHRLENQPVPVTNTKHVPEVDKDEKAVTPGLQEKADAYHQDENLPVSPNKTLQKPQNSEACTTEAEGLHSYSEPSEAVKNTLLEKQKAFNESMVGKKNLQLVKMLADNDEKNSSSENSSSECDDGSSTSSDSDSSNCSFVDGTTALSNERKASPYSLRPRKAINNPFVSNVNLNTNKEKKSAKEVEKPSTSKAEAPVIETLPEKQRTQPSTHQDGLLKQMEQIRQRTIAKFKDINNANAKKGGENSKKKKPISKLKASEKDPLKNHKQGAKPQEAVEDVLPCNKDSDIANKIAVKPTPNVTRRQQRKSDSPKKLKRPEVIHKQENIEASKAVNKINQNKTKLESTKHIKELEPVTCKESTNKSANSEPKLGPPKKLKEPKTTVPKEGLLKASNLKCNQVETKPSSVKSTKQSMVKQSKLLHQKEKPGTLKATLKTQTQNQNKSKPLPSKNKKQPVYSPQKSQVECISFKEAKAMVDEEEDIILHLSSDEETLEPFEMVEAELLECSVSSTPIADEDRFLMYGTNLTSNLSKKSDNEEKTEEMKDLEAESLVKGLKQWGIHLIPNKTPKKTAASAEAKEIVTGNKANHQSSEHSTEKIPKSCITQSQKKLNISKEKQVKIDKEKQVKIFKENEVKLDKEEQAKLDEEKKVKVDTEKQVKISKDNEVKLDKEKPKRVNEEKLNSSLEEGEIISDDENDYKRKVTTGKYKSNSIKMSASTKAPKVRRNSDSIKQNKRYKDTKRSSQETQRFRSYSEGKNKASTVSSSTISSLSSKFTKSTESNLLTSKTTKMPTETCKEYKEIKDTDISKTTDIKESAINEIDYLVEFDIKTFDEENLRLTHDYSKKSNRKVSDYDFGILTKKFSANVYIAEIDSEVEKFLAFTPFESLLDIPSKSSASVSQRRGSNTNRPSTSQPSNVKHKKQLKPLNILYDQLVKPGNDSTFHSSPLDHLYSPDPQIRTNSKPNEESHKRYNEKYTSSERSDKDDKADKSDKSDRGSKFKSKSLCKEKTLPKEHSHSSSSERSKKEKTSEKKQVVNTENPCMAEPSNNANSVKSDVSSNKKQNTEQAINNLEVIDGVIMLNSNSEDTDKDPDDDLMNYALIGSERVENNETLPTENKKRKASGAVESEKNQDKKQKTEVCQELLRNIDVDSFLKKLHGET